MAGHSHGGVAGDWGGARSRPVPHKHYATATVRAILQDGLADSHSWEAARSVGEAIAPTVRARIGTSAIVRALQAPQIFSLNVADLLSDTLNSHHTCSALKTLNVHCMLTSCCMHPAEVSILMACSQSCWHDKQLKGCMQQAN